MLSWRKSFAYFLNPLTITIYDGLMHFKKLKLSYCLLHYYIRLFIFIKNTNYKIMNKSKLDLYEFTFTAITTSQHPVFFSHIHVIFTCKLIHIPISSLMLCRLNSAPKPLTVLFQKVHLIHHPTKSFRMGWFDLVCTNNYNYQPT